MFLLGRWEWRIRAICGHTGWATWGVMETRPEAWEKRGIIVSCMRSLPVSLYVGDLFDNNTAVIIPHNPSHLHVIWAFCQSSEFCEAVRRIDQKLNVTTDVHPSGQGLIG